MKHKMTVFFFQLSIWFLKQRIYLKQSRLFLVQRVSLTILMFLPCFLEFVNTDLVGAALTFRSGERGEGARRCPARHPAPGLRPASLHLQCILLLPDNWKRPVHWPLFRRVQR